MEKDYYKILGVERNATKDQIHRGYLKQCKKYHPDAQAGKSDSEKKEAEEQMKLVNEANDVLSNPEKKQYYDNFGTIDGMNNGGPHGGFSQEDIMREFMKRGFGHMGGMGGFNPFGEMGGFEQENNPPDPNAPQDGVDVRIRVNIPFEDIIYGSSREFEIDVKDPCEHCKGTGSDDGKLNTCPTCHGSGMETQRNGFVIMQQTCRHCHGTGYSASTPCHVCNGNKFVINKRDIKIDIPQGIQSGEFIKVLDKGTKGLNGGKNGDILIQINSIDNELFVRDNLNIITTTFISPFIATLGGNIDVLTPWGLAKLKIPSGTTDGKVFRMSGKGVKSKDGIGDMYVKINIETVDNLTEEQHKLFEKLNKTISEENLKKYSMLLKKYKEYEDKNKDKMNK